jgi:hypothetical protein
MGLGTKAWMPLELAELRARAEASGSAFGRLGLGWDMQRGHTSEQQDVIWGGGGWAPNLSLALRKAVVGTLIKTAIPQHLCGNVLKHGESPSNFASHLHTARSSIQPPTWGRLPNPDPTMTTP